MTETRSQYTTYLHKFYCGIDPGFTGGIAIIDGEQRIVEVHDMPLHGIKSKQEIDCNKVISILLNYQLCHIAIEKAQAMPRQGCVSMFRYGDGYGQIKGICAALRLKHTLVTPQSWKKRMMQGMDKGKGAAIVRAEQLFDFQANKKNDHGRAEAVLIAEFGRLLITGRNDRLEDKFGCVHHSEKGLEQDYVWHCSTCERYVPSQHVTFQETHDPRFGGCGKTVTVVEYGEC